MAIQKSDYQRVFASVFTGAEELLTNSDNQDNALNQYLESWVEIAEKAAELNNFALQDVILIFIDASRLTFKDVTHLTETHWQLLKKWDALFAAYIKSPENVKMAKALVDCISSPIFSAGLTSKDQQALLKGFNSVAEQISPKLTQDSSNTISAWQEISRLFDEAVLNLQDVFTHQITEDEASFSESLKLYFQDWQNIVKLLETESKNSKQCSILLDISLLFLDVSTQGFNQINRLTEEQQFILNRWHNLFSSYLKTRGSRQIALSLIKVLSNPVWNEPITPENEALLLKKTGIDFSEKHHELKESSKTSKMDAWSNIEVLFLDAVADLQNIQLTQEREDIDKHIFKEKLKSYQKNWQNIVNRLKEDSQFEPVLNVVLSFIDNWGLLFENQETFQQHLAIINKWHSLFGHYLKVKGDGYAVEALIKCLTNFSWPKPMTYQKADSLAKNGVLETPVSCDIDELFEKTYLNLKTAVDFQILGKRLDVIQQLQEYINLWQIIAKELEKDSQTDLLAVVVLFNEAINSNIRKIHDLNSEQLGFLNKWQQSFKAYRNAPSPTRALNLINCLTNSIYSDVIDVETEKKLFKDFKIENKFVDRDTALKIFAQTNEKDNKEITGSVVKEELAPIWKQVVPVFTEAVNDLKGALDQQIINNFAAFNDNLQHYLNRWNQVYDILLEDEQQQALAEVVRLFIKISEETFGQLKSLTSKHFSLLNQWHNLFDNYINTGGSKTQAQSLIQCLSNPLWSQAISVDDGNELLANFHFLRKEIKQILPTPEIKVQKAVIKKKHVVWEKISHFFNDAKQQIETITKLIADDKAQQCFQYLHQFINQWFVIAEIIEEESETDEQLSALVDISFLIADNCMEIIEQNVSIGSVFSQLMQSWHVNFENYLTDISNQQILETLIDILKSDYWLRPLTQEDHDMLLDMLVIEDELMFASDDSEDLLSFNEGLEGGEQESSMFAEESIDPNSELFFTEEVEHLEKAQEGSFFAKEENEELLFADEELNFEEESKTLDEDRLASDKVEEDSREELSFAEDVEASEENELMFAEESEEESSEELSFAEDVEASEENELKFPEESEERSSEELSFAEEVESADEDELMFSEEVEEQSSEELSFAEDVEASEENELMFAEESEEQSSEELSFAEDVEASEENELMFPEESEEQSSEELSFAEDVEASEENELMFAEESEEQSSEELSFAEDVEASEENELMFPEESEEQSSEGLSFAEDVEASEENELMFPEESEEQSSEELGFAEDVEASEENELMFPEESEEESTEELSFAEDVEASEENELMFAEESEEESSEELSFAEDVEEEKESDLAFLEEKEEQDSVEKKAKHVNPELIGMVKDEFNLLVKQLNEEIEDISDAESFKVSLNEHHFKFENLAKACNTIGLLALEKVFEQLSINMHSRRATDPDFSEVERRLFVHSLPLIQDYIEDVNDVDKSNAIIALLKADNWKQPLTDTDAEELKSLFAELVVNSSEEQLSNRKTVAEPSDVSLELPKDVNQELLDSLLNELPTLTGNFSEVIQQIISKSGSRDVQKLLEAQRIAHTLKGSGNIVGISGIAVLTHHLEEILEYLTEQQTFPTKSLSKVLLESADCLEQMSDLMLNGQWYAPDQALSVLQNVLDWANKIAKEGLPQEEETEEDSTLPAEPNTDTKSVIQTPKPEATAMTRVPSELVDNLLRMTGEGSILSEQFKERINVFTDELKRLNDLTWHMQSLVSELDQTISIQNFGNFNTHHNEFDALEMEQYNELHTAASRISEVATDIREVNINMDEQLVDLKYLMIDEENIQKENQEMVQSIRMVPASTIASRCHRIVRQACRMTNKEVELEILGADILIDSEILNDMVDPLMHLLRNSVDHGIEPAHIRERNNKDKVGKITLEFNRKGNYAVISCKDDGGGLSSGNILQTAIKKGLVSAEQTLSEAEIHKLILIPGFSTRAVATQVSGRGIGMDAIQTQISALQGQMNLFSERGKGLSIEISVPLTLSSILSLLIRCNGQTMAISNRGLLKIYHADDCHIIEEDDKLYCEINYERFPACYFSDLVGMNLQRNANLKLPALRIEDEIGKNQIVLVDELLGYRDLLVKNMGIYIPHVQGITGASILGNGAVAPVIDLVELLHNSAKYEYLIPEAAKGLADSITGLPIALVVDDSLSARRAVAMLLEDSGIQVETAIDGLDAIKQIEKNQPDILIVDLEMPRMNGIELAAHIRGREEMLKTPIIMITSRATEKHRKQAEAAGVTEFMTKPFSEDELMNNVRMLMEA